MRSLKMAIMSTPLNDSSVPSLESRSPDRSRATGTRLRGRSLILARAGWIALIIFTVLTFFASLPVYLAQLQTPCAGSACWITQLTPEQAVALKGIGLSPGAYAAYTVVLTLVTMVVCLVVSTLIVLRRPEDHMALLVALLLVMFGPLVATSSVVAVSSPWQVPNACLYFLALALLVLVFLLFPSGQFVPSFMRWTLVVFLAGLVPTAFVAPFMPNTPVYLLTNLVVIGELATLAIVQLYRYRRVSSPIQRQQTKWVVFGIAVFGTISVSGGVLTLIFPVGSEPGLFFSLALDVVAPFLVLLIPLSFGFAILRYRLWDIDLIIRRTLIYSTLTVLLAVIYEVSVFTLQYLTSGLALIRGNQLAIFASTLLIGILIKPLYDRIRAFIDRRFYRRKYDAARTVAAFSTTVRDEVDLNRLKEDLLAAVQETMQPAHVSLWLCPPKRYSEQTTRALHVIDAESEP
jgi:hypothetical protein